MTRIFESDSPLIFNTALSNSNSEQLVLQSLSLSLYWLKFTQSQHWITAKVQNSVNSDTAIFTFNNTDYNSQYYCITCICDRITEDTIYTIGANILQWLFTDKSCLCQSGPGVFGVLKNIILKDYRIGLPTCNMALFPEFKLMIYIILIVSTTMAVLQQIY